MPKLVYGFSTVSDGNMSYVWGHHDEVLASRKTFLNKLSLNYSSSVIMTVQNKATDVFEVTKPDKGSGLLNIEDAPNVDALITEVPNINLLLLTADCYPVIIYSSNIPALALIHAGWRGVHERIVPNTIAVMQKTFGVTPESLKVIIGPGIDKNSYAFESVGQERSPQWQPYLERVNGRVHVDVLGYLKDQILECGIYARNISLDTTDTASDSKYFSHYRSTRSDQPEGRFMTVAVII